VEENRGKLWNWQSANNVSLGIRASSEKCYCIKKRQKHKENGLKRDTEKKPNEMEILTKT
jgi:hypothetical protein